MEAAGGRARSARGPRMIMQLVLSSPWQRGRANQGSAYHLGATNLADSRLVAPLPGSMSPQYPISLSGVVPVPRKPRTWTSSAHFYLHARRLEPWSLAEIWSPHPAPRRRGGKCCWGGAWPVKPSMDPCLWQRTPLDIVFQSARPALASLPTRRRRIYAHPHFFVLPPTMGPDPRMPGAGCVALLSRSPP